MSNYKYVNIKMGTKNTMRFSNGNVLPIVAVPYGMATFTIQNERNGAWFYSPDSKSFEGIRLTHQASPWVNDYGQLIICGQNGKLETEENMRWSFFDNKKCHLEPASMSAYVTRDRYSFNLAPTNSGALITFDFVQSRGNRINFIGDGKTEFYKDEATSLVLGYTTACKRNPPCGELKEYFAISVDVSFELEQAENAVSLKIPADKATVRIATSFISQEQAILNHRRELLGKNLDEIYLLAKNEWEKYLSRIEIEDNSPDAEERKKTFYSCLYRVFLWPRRFYEMGENGEILHFNMHTGKPETGYMYTDNGFWDTCRTVYPLLSLIDTDIYAEMAESFYNYYKDSGWLPKWLCPSDAGFMPGMLVEAVMADAVVKDITNKELSEKILEALLKDGETSENGKGRKGAEEYRKYGFVPYTTADESVNETLDSCYGDYCIAEAAKHLGKSEIADRYFGYAQNYRNLFDPETGFMRAKDENGNFRDEEFDFYAWGRDYTEGSAWQNSFAVYHDIEGLNKLYGGKLQEKIDELVNTPAYYSVGGYEKEIHEMSEMAACDFGQCAISNQPSFHIPYIYSELGNVAKTAELVEKLCGVFNSTEEGFPGDEDNGSMGAWYVLSCLGFYQMCPSRPDFTMSLPLFDSIKVKLANKNVLTITKARLEAEKIKNKVAYFDIMKGGDLESIALK